MIIMSLIQRELSQTETPFTWNVPKSEMPIDAFILNQKEKSENITDENEFKWTGFTLNLLLAYEYCETKEDTTNALIHIDFCEAHLQSLTNIDCDEPLFNSIKPVLWHVTQATKAHILFRTGKLDQVNLLIKKIKPLNGTYEKAGIYGVKAAYYIQYGTKGHRLALESAKIAKNMDPEQAEWHFIVGNAMSRLRKTEYGKISEEETEAILKAFYLQKDATYTVHMAQLCVDLSRELYFSAQGHNGMMQRSKNYARQAVDLFKEAINRRPNCTSLKVRIAHALLQIKFKEFVDKHYIKRLLDEVVIATPNNSLVHYNLGVYYDTFENNVDRAISSLKKSTEQGNNKALSHLMRLKWRNGFQQEIIGDLEEALEIFKRKENVAETLVHLGVSYLLINNDWTSAIMRFNEYLKLDQSAKYIKVYSAYGPKINLLQEITNEVRFKITGEDFPPEFQQFLHLSKSIHPSMFAHSAKTGEFEKWKIKLSKAKRC